MIYKAKKKKKYILINQINKLLYVLEESNLHDLVYIFGNKREVARRNFVAGLFRGIGIGIGVTIITAILIFVLERIVELNLPVIGEFIAKIVKVVEMSR